jgi:hypothetical protein
MMTDTQRSDLKRMVRETEIQFFQDKELDEYFEECGEDLRKTAHKLLIIKAEDSTLSVSGLSSSDTSKYFLRLARMYRPNNSGIQKGVY